MTGAPSAATPTSYIPRTDTTTTATTDLRRYPYAEYSELTGPFREPAADYRVRYTSLTQRTTMRLRGVLLVGTALVFELAFLIWLVWPSHYPVNTGGLASYLSMTMVVSIGAIETMRLLNIMTLCYATLNARDPVPVRPEPGLKVAFVTTIVPSKEPLEMARATLEAALRIRHDGELDVWLLDEGNDAEVKELCAQLGVHHFSRKGIKRWNQPTGRNKAKTKHGNYNAWLEAAGYRYDMMISVDTDHVPLENFAERLLGYFRDPDIAFVVGPQVYGNYDNFITKAAESQQYLFHSVLQRAANRFDTAMFVGTNNAARISSLLAIGGLQDSITEDAATSLEWHSSRNPKTGRQWKSVYTPDVLAVGEGPTSWTDYFTQQYRWSRGTNEVVLGRYWSTRGLGWRRRLHYFLLMSYYPSAALSWVLGMLNISLYLFTGIGGVEVAARLWLMLYVNAAVLQMAIYFWNRRHNVSPHEEEGSSGVMGMFVSVLSAPMYVSALVDAVRRRENSFVVTPKGDSMSPDSVGTFARNLQWGAWSFLALVASLVLGHDHPAMRVWAVIALVISVLPPAIWLVGRETASRDSTSSHATEPAHDTETAHDTEKVPA